MQRQFKITVNGTDYNVAVSELTETTSQTVTAASASPISHAPSVTPAAATSSASAQDQCAPMGGVIAAIHVKEGQNVNEGDRIMELEAMKMKVPVTADHSGKISRILVTLGDSVASGQPLVTIG